MAIPRQVFFIVNRENKVIDHYQNYFYPLMTEDEALKRYCEIERCLPDGLKTVLYYDRGMDKS